jgi:hypothetical protein
VRGMIGRAAAVAGANKAIRALIILAQVACARMRPRSGSAPARKPVSATCWSPAPGG